MTQKNTALYDEALAAATLNDATTLRALLLAGLDPLALVGSKRFTNIGCVWHAAIQNNATEVMAAILEGWPDTAARTRGMTARAGGREALTVALWTNAEKALSFFVEHDLPLHALSRNLMYETSVWGALALTGHEEMLAGLKRPAMLPTDWANGDMLSMMGSSLKEAFSPVHALAAGNSTVLLRATLSTDPNAWCVPSRFVPVVCPRPDLTHWRRPSFRFVDASRLTNHLQSPASPSVAQHLAHGFDALDWALFAQSPATLDVLRASIGADRIAERAIQWHELFASQEPDFAANLHTLGIQNITRELAIGAHRTMLVFFERTALRIKLSPVDQNTGQGVGRARL